MGQEHGGVRDPERTGTAERPVFRLQGKNLFRKDAFRQTFRFRAVRQVKRQRTVQEAAFRQLAEKVAFGALRPGRMAGCAGQKGQEKDDALHHFLIYRSLCPVPPRTGWR